MCQPEAKMIDLDEYVASIIINISRNCLCDEQIDPLFGAI